MVAVAVVGLDGQALGAGVKNAVDAELQAKREVNFVFNVIDPTFSTIHVNVQVVPHPGYAQAAAEANAIEALTEFLTPSRWGKIPVGQDDRMWVNETKVYYQDLVTVVNNAEGVARYTNLQVKKGAGSFGTSDITLDGAAPLPTPGTIQIA